jgi:thiopurine S-methyltransferase
MQPKFWLDRWRNNQIGWHQAEHNPLLQTYWPELGVDASVPVFVPLCGKSLDMRWLEHAGHDVIGVEMSQLAAEAYFSDSEEAAVVDALEDFVRYRGRGTAILQGDFFALTSNCFPKQLSVFDRGALVALPLPMRRRYVDHLLRVVPDGTRMLLLTFEYDQNLVAGPPHAVSPDEVADHYSERCEVEQLDSIVTSSLPAHFTEQGVSQAVEAVYRITKLQ